MLLARALDQPIVLALPRGGVPVAVEVAAVLGAPLGVLAVRKLGVPGRAELAFGAVASGGIRVLDESLLAALGSVDAATVERVTMREREELGRRDAAYRASRSAPPLDARIVVLVDDGIATGSTMRAAAAAAASSRAATVVVATPVASGRAIQMLADAVDEVIVALIPARFTSVGEHYRDFRQLTDADVIALLAGA